MRVVGGAVVIDADAADLRCLETTRHLPLLELGVCIRRLAYTPSSTTHYNHRLEQAALQGKCTQTRTERHLQLRCR